MNRTAAKLLSKYATSTERDLKPLKRWWKSLNWEEKTKEKRRIEEELGGSAATDKETESSK